MEGRASNPTPIEDFTFTNNLTLHNANGVHGQGRAVGQDTLDTFFPDAVFTRECDRRRPGDPLSSGQRVPDRSRVRAPVRQLCRQDYRLASSTPYKLGGTDRHDLGADILAAAPGGRQRPRIERVHRRNIATAAIVRDASRATIASVERTIPNRRALLALGSSAGQPSFVDSSARPARAVQ